jgi:hypothetical protein
LAFNKRLRQFIGSSVNGSESYTHQFPKQAKKKKKERIEKKSKAQ